MAASSSSSAMLPPPHPTGQQLSNCPHLAVSVGFMSAPDLRRHVAVARCDICEAGPDGLWLCLYPDCFMLGCSEGRDHSSLHNHKNERHCVQLNIDSKRIWCYKCNAEAEIYSDPKRKFGALLPAPKDGVPVARPGTQQDSALAAFTPAGLVGLTNLGNTCYMNAALQCLLNIPALTEFFSTCPALVHKADKNAMSKAFLKLAEDVWRRGGQGHGGSPRSFLSPTGVLYALKAAYPMFRGFHQHDSQEFLRCIMDQLHEELLEPLAGNGEGGDDDNLDSVSEVGSGGSPIGSDGEGDPEEYETADSGVSEQSSTCSEAGAAASGGAGAKGGGSRKRKMSRANAVAAPDGKREKEDHEPASCSASGDTGVGSLPSPDAAAAELDFVDAASTHSGSPPMSASPLSASPPLGARILAHRTGRAGITMLQKRRPIVYRSVISDIFDGKLVSSVQCLSCDRVSTTTEIFQDLSLPIPTHDVLATVRQQPAGSAADNAAGASWVSWVYNWVSGWFYGPNITLIDCLSYFFSADELKGDNMYSCERCKKLRNGLKYSRVTVLPDTLCIHLKRFRHEFAFSSKISTKVTFPIVDLDMSPWLHKDSYSNVSLFDLTGVICHHGSAGGGHYTAYALNPISQEWYEFDDSTVTKVEPATVLNSEAYVLFYRKNNLENEPMRMEMQLLLSRDVESPGLIQFYVSRQWLNKFDNFAEPGPVDNSDFLCPHGGVQPLKSGFVYELCVALPQSVWDLLHGRFGGGPACTRLYECAQCRHELDALTKQKKFELEEFKALHEEFKEQESPSAIYCLSSSWFKAWEGFVTHRHRDPPGPIDNKAIITSATSSPGQSGSGGMGGSSGQTLRTSSDYLQVSHDVWQLFQTIYGGGPEVVIRPSGAVYVSPPQSSSQQHPGRALLGRSWSKGAHGGVVTRSKARSISELISDMRQQHQGPMAPPQEGAMSDDAAAPDVRQEEDPEL